jgi:hypothetical protein
MNNKQKQSPNRIVISNRLLKQRLASLHSGTSWYQMKVTPKDDFMILDDEKDSSSCKTLIKRDMTKSEYFGISSLRGLQPDRMPFHLKYSTRITLNSGVATAAVHVFEANGMYDPDITGVGGQPRGFDQFMLLYDHFLVTQASIDVVFGPADAAAICGVTTYDKSATLTDITDYTEQGSTVYKSCPTTQGYECRLHHKVDIAKFLSKRNLRDEKDLHGNATNNPVEDVMFHVWAGSMSSTADATALNAYVTLHFYGEFNEPKDPGAS